MVGAQAFLDTTALKQNKVCLEKMTQSNQLPELMSKQFTKSKSKTTAGPCPIGTLAPSPWFRAGLETTPELETSGLTTRLLHPGQRAP